MSSGTEFQYLFDRINNPNMKEHMTELKLRWAGQRDASWSDQQKVAMLDTILRGWSCSPIYVLKKETDGVIIDCVFDGAHKLEAPHEFMNGGYAIKKFNEGWETSPLKEFEGKKFKELPSIVRDKIKNYKFSINYIPDDVSDDPEALSVLWQRLNNAGTPLNGYELKIPVFGLLHDILEEESKEWYNSAIYTKSESKRGSCEERLYQLLALSEADNLQSFSSLPGLADKWRSSHGKQTQEISKKINENKEEYKGRLNKMRRMLTSLEEHHAFEVDGKEIEDMKDHRVPLLLFIGRLGFWFKKISQFNVHVAAIASTLNTDFFSKKSDETVKLMECASRNAKFQYAVINYIDDYIRSLTKEKRRFFNPKERKITLEKQAGKCAGCNLKLKISDAEADHIVPFLNGGETTLNNCQMLHKHCHRNKNLVGS